MIRLLIIADDLTGANDTGVHFAKRGIGTFVTPDVDVRFDMLPGEISVLVVDTDSRHLPPDEASRRVGRVARRAADSSVTHLYKKTDSTLRGNVGAELEAVMTAVGARRLAFIPAYPKTGRTTRAGRQYVNGVPLEESSFGRDAIEPTDESYVPAILKRQTELPVTVLSPRDDGAGKAFGSIEEGGGIVVFDCESDGDLKEIARLLAAQGALGLTAGPGGFAEELSRCMDLPRGVVTVEKSDGPLLAVCGSRHEASRRQVAFAVEHGFAGIALPEDVNPSSGGGLGEGVEELLRKAARCGREGRHVVVWAPGVECRANQVGGGDGGGGAAATRALSGTRLVAANLARFAASVLERAPFGACAVFGGDTALEVVRAIGCRGILPKCEISPGVVLSQLAGSRRPLSFVTKAGGFGGKGVLLEIVEHLERLR